MINQDTIWRAEEVDWMEVWASIPDVSYLLLTYDRAYHMCPRDKTVLSSRLEVSVRFGNLSIVQPFLPPLSLISPSFCAPLFLKVQ